MSSFLTEEEIEKLHLKRCGKDVHISRNAVFYSPEHIEIGDHVRIDDFCFVSGGVGICIGDYVHIAAYSALYGAHGIQIGNYVNISSRVNIYSTSDDYSGEYLTGPMVESKYIHDVGETIMIEDMVIVGAGTIILPGTKLEQGVAIGAMSLVKTEGPAYTIYAGIPAKFIKNRSKNMLKLLEEMKDKSHEKNN